MRYELIEEFHRLSPPSASPVCPLRKKHVSFVIVGIPGIVSPANPFNRFIPHARAAIIASNPAVDAMVLNLMSGSARSSFIAPFKTLKWSDRR